MPCITIRGCAIGEGRPKTIVPIVEQSEVAILAAACSLAGLHTDCVEWRADWFDHVSDSAAVLRCLRALRAALGEKLLLVTFRTKAEGGEQALDAADYEAFCRLVCESGCADLIDIELFTAGAALPALIETAHSSGVKVVCSSHDFANTPPQAEMVARMVKMQQAGADLPKLAVMPRSRQDVLALLGATAEMADSYPSTPVITMSMGPIGAVSRVCGEAFGSAMTFACVGRASAPGQIGLDEMNRILDALSVDKG